MADTPAHQLPSLFTPNPIHITKAWQNGLNPSTRTSIIYKTVKTIFPTVENMIENILESRPVDPRLMNLCNYAKRFESQFFAEADSGDEYYHLMRAKIRNILAELEIKRQERRRRQQEGLAASAA